MKKLLLFAMVLAMAVFISSYAFAQNDLLYGCVKRTGTLRIVAMQNLCTKGEAQITINLSGVPGPKGDAGSQGPKGDIGLTGATGFQGPLGLKGDTGSQGSIGNEGPQGPSGPKGDKGNPGPSLYMYDSGNQFLGILVNADGASVDSTDVIVYNIPTAKFINFTRDTSLIIVDGGGDCYHGVPFIKESDLKLYLEFLYINSNKIYKPNFAIGGNFHDVVFGPLRVFYEILNGVCIGPIEPPDEILYRMVEEHNVGFNFPIQFPLKAIYQ